jgi:hypothetical protein
MHLEMEETIYELVDFGQASVSTTSQVAGNMPPQATSTHSGTEVGLLDDNTADALLG